MEILLFGTTNQPKSSQKKTMGFTYVLGLYKTLNPSSILTMLCLSFKKNQIQGLLKAQDVQVGQIVMYYEQPATVLELPNAVSWAYIIDVNGQKVVTTIFQLEAINY